MLASAKLPLSRTVPGSKGDGGDEKSSSLVG